MAGRRQARGRTDHIACTVREPTAPGPPVHREAVRLTIGPNWRAPGRGIALPPRQEQHRTMAKNGWRPVDLPSSGEAPPGGRGYDRVAAAQLDHDAIVAALGCLRAELAEISDS